MKPTVSKVKLVGSREILGLGTNVRIPQTFEGFDRAIETIPRVQFLGTIGYACGGQILVFGQPFFFAACV